MKIKIKFLILSALLLIIPLSFLFTGCKNEDENKAMDEKISRLEKEAEKLSVNTLKALAVYPLDQNT